MEAVELAYDEYVTQQTDNSRCPIILLHGLSWNKYMFQELANDLCVATRRKVFCLDLRNHDQSPFREEFNSMVMTEDLKRFIMDRQLKKIAFVCHSFSCIIAYQFMADNPDIVEKVVMIDHTPYISFNEQRFQELVVPQFTSQNRFLKTLDPSMSLSAAKQKILNLCRRATKTQAIFLQKIAYDLTKENNKFKWKTDHKFLLEKYHDERNFCFPPRGSIDHEILIVRCEGSQRVTDECFAAVLEFNPNAKLMTMPDTSHLLMLEKKDEFVEAVKDFLA